MIKEDQMHQITNSIYQISTIINSILKMIESPYQTLPDGTIKSLFSLENCTLVINILCLLTPKQNDILRDFSITDKIMKRLEVELQII